MKQKSIMIVEDEMIVAEDLRQRLSLLGYNVVATFGSGEEALAHVEDLSPDLVLMDIVLEGSSMDGIETARSILMKQEVPIIFVTAFADDITLDRAKAADPFAYILKPFNERELHSAIELALHKHQREQEIKKRDEILFAISFSVEGYLRQGKECRKAQENPSRVEEAGIRELLEHIRIAAHAKSAAIFQLEPGEGDGNGNARVRFFSAESCPESGIMSPANEYAYLNFSSALWKFFLASGNAIAGDISNLAGGDRLFFEEQGILSIAILPVFKNDILWGFIGYADSVSREWSEGEIEGLMLAGNIMGAVMD